MSAESALDHVLIGHAPVLDARFQPLALRLVVFADGRPVPRADALLQALVGAAGEAAPTPASPWLLSLTDEAWLAQALPCAVPGMLIEVPAFLAGGPSWQPLLAQARGLGVGIVLRGRAAVPGQGASVVRVLDVDEPAPDDDAAVWRAGVHSLSGATQAIARGDAATIGWPLDDETPRAGNKVPPELAGVIELMNRVDREEPVERLESVLAGDPALAFRMLRYLNASAFGLRTEITSFRHALMMLGHQRLKRWLVLLLATGGRNATARPLMMAATRRALLMEALGRSADEAMRGEMFICGIFSLLDRLLQVPMRTLMDSVPVNARIQASLLGDGPYAAHLALACAVEGQGTGADIRQAAERVLVAPAELNRSLLGALARARTLES